ncbi:hypothetical protein EHV15_35895 [Paenibacillus oralis]|uniref:Uncharacterized protein n=1 Tax=Paenibacillus oralis TaxID=2490856 RepID=A0A3P3TA85_9BACL|nr:hypothetical protein [Paenibacillus oralis]RRJ54956.1 hypothetical protein EHV15_35895 [Paenibacillus oralis]
MFSFNISTPLYSIPSLHTRNGRQLRAELSFFFLSIMMIEKLSDLSVLLRVAKKLKEKQNAITGVFGVETEFLGSEIGALECEFCRSVGLERDMGSSQDNLFWNFYMGSLSGEALLEIMLEDVAIFKRYSNKEIDLEDMYEAKRGLRSKHGID